MIVMLETRVQLQSPNLTPKWLGWGNISTLVKVRERLWLGLTVNKHTVSILFVSIETDHSFS